MFTKQSKPKEWRVKTTLLTILRGSKTTFKLLAAAKSTLAEVRLLFPGS